MRTTVDRGTRADFLSEQSGHNFKFYRKVNLYRRQWNDTAYELDTALNIDDYIIDKKFGKVSMSQDRDLQTWKIGNLDFHVSNINQEWNRSNMIGLWGGYLIEYSVITVEYGYEDSDGDKHGVAIFRGVLTQDGVQEDIEKMTAKIHVRGYNEVMVQFSAEDLADNQIPGENMGTGDASETEFTTVKNGVGKFKVVYIDGVEKVPGTDYSISDLNDPDTPGKITFTDPVPNGDDVTADYVYWYQDKTFKYLIEKILDHCGITDYSVQDVNYPNNILNQWIQNTEAEFDAGTLTYMHTPGDQLQMAMEKHSAGPRSFSSKSEVLGDVVAQSFIPHVSGTMIQLGFVESDDATPHSCTAYIYADVGGHPGGAPLASKNFTSCNSTSYFQKDISGWSLALTAGTTYWLCIATNVDGQAIRLAGKGDGYSDGFVSRYSGITLTWTDYASNDLFFYIRYATGIYNYMSSTLDCGADLSSYGAFESVPSPTGTFTYYTLSKTTDGDPGDEWPASFDPADWDEVVGGVIASDVKRYVRFAVAVTYAPILQDDIHSGDNDATPNLDSVTINYYTSTFEIKMANLTGMSCYNAIKEMARISDYEFAFKPDGSFFFRQKSSDSTYDLLLYGITKIKEFKIDWGRVYNEISCTFGNFTRYMNPTKAGDLSPHSQDKYGVRILDISDSQLLIDDDVDIAGGIVERYYEDYKDPRWKCRLMCKGFYQLELGDIVRLSYLSTDSTLLTWDDKDWDDLYWGDDPLPYGLDMKVIGITIDTDFLKDGGVELELLQM